MPKKSLIDRLIGSSNKIEASTITDSKLFGNRDVISTVVPLFNIAFSGDYDGGYSSGITTIAGPSKHFKTMVGLVCMKAYLDKYPDAVVLFYDSEFGTPTGYFKSMDIDPNRVIHAPITDIENLTHDIVQRLKELSEGKGDDKVFIFVDSLGNTASIKEATDALDGKSVSDMTRAKAIKSMFRIITPRITALNIPLFVINHTYDSMDFYSKPIVSGGKGVMLSSDTVWIMGRRQVKDGKEVAGYDFVINVEKSRFVKEHSKLPISVSFEEGINKYSGLLDIALDTGHVYAPSKGWYAILPNTPTNDKPKAVRKADTFTEAFWNAVLYNEDGTDRIPDQLGVSFKEAIINQYMLVHKSKII